MVKKTLLYLKGEREINPDRKRNGKKIEKLLGLRKEEILSIKNNLDNEM